MILVWWLWCCALVVWRPPATRRGAHGLFPSLTFIPAIVFPANDRLCIRSLAGLYIL
jgi:hypothetical protein